MNSAKSAREIRGMTDVARMSEATPVGSPSRAVGQARRPHDDPIQRALLDDPFLGLVIGDNVAQQYWRDQIPADQTELTSAFPDPEKRQVYQTPHAALFHGANDMTNPVHQCSVSTQRSRRAKRTEHAILAHDCRGHSRCLRHVS